MSQIAIQKCKDPETTPQTLLERMEAITDAIRNRAFEMFQHRENGNGSDLDDWLRAERDVVWFPASEMVDDDGEFKATLAVPGFEAKDIQVSALPDALIIHADATHTHDGKSESVRYCEFSEKQLFRRLDWPAPVDVDKVNATVDNGILRITAPKAETLRMSAGA